MTIFVASLFLPLTLNKKLDTVKRSSYGNIGLQNAVRSAADSSSSPFVWIGCVSPTFRPEDQEFAELLLKEDSSCIGVYPSIAQLEGHYLDFCKQILWKPFHYQFQDYPKGMTQIKLNDPGVLFEKLAWEHYVAGKLTPLVNYA
jgi:trehalose-6-phosphate synthase